MNKKRFDFSKVLLFGVLVLFISSCGLIYDDEVECPPAPKTNTIVKFVYDYNMQKTDLFDKHVGSVYLYVFDEKGVFRYKRELHKALMGKKSDFSIEFDESEIMPGNTYQFVAVAQGNNIGYEDSRETKGFALLNEMIPGVSMIEDYVLKLDRDDDGTYDFGIINYKDDFGNSEAMIDTVWTTKPDEVQTVKIPKLDFVPTLQKQPDRIVNVTIPMMRITNSIKVTLRGDLFNENTSEDDYHILVHFPHGNGTIDFTGRTLPAQELYYQTLRKKKISYFAPGEDLKTRNNQNDIKYGIEAVFGVSRLQIGDESGLQIRDAASNRIIAEIPDFSDYIAEAFDHDMDNQEFLDREYDFDVDITLTPTGEIAYVVLSLKVVGWSVRLNYISEFS